MNAWIPVLGIILVIILVISGILVMIAKFYRKVDQGKALIVNKMKVEPDVTFTGATVLPIIHRAEVMDISLKTIEVARAGSEGLICKDNIRADIKVTFFVRVNKTVDDVLKVAQAIGCARASDQATLEELFLAKFSEALKTVGKGLDFVELYEMRDKFRDTIIEVIGSDLNGYVLEDAAIDYLEQTPLDKLDPANILDAEGIRKITDLTAAQNEFTNARKQLERKTITQQNVEAEEAILELKRQHADAEAKQQREIATMQARETAETQKIQAEEKAKAELARLDSEQLIAKREEEKLREVEVAKKNRERVVAIESERVIKDSSLEAIGRERAVELTRIDKEKALEVEKKAIADVVRTRIVVDKSVAEEEEAIKTLRTTEEANRSKVVAVVAAEASAEESLIKEIKAAEAKETVAGHTAKERLILADAELERADKLAKAKIRMAEGTQAEQAATGLAEVRVREANAIALEKEGAAEARVTLQKMEASATGSEKQGLAAAAVKEADATATEKHGLAKATVAREQALAEAAGSEEQGLADARVREAEAAAIEKTGQAEALAIREKMAAEASGLSEKAAAMKALDGVGREHEEFRLRLDKDREVEMETIRVRKDIAVAQADVLGKALGNADFHIVGGDGRFFDKFVDAVSLGKSVDGAIDSSDVLQKVLQPYLDGERSLPNDLKDVLSRPAIDADTVQKLSVSAFLGTLMKDADGDTKGKLMALLAKAREVGLVDDSSL